MHEEEEEAYEMDIHDVAGRVAAGLDYDYLAEKGITFGGWTKEGFTLEHGDDKFKVTFTKE